MTVYYARWETRWNLRVERSNNIYLVCVLFLRLRLERRRAGKGIVLRQTLHGQRTLLPGQCLCERRRR